MFQTTNQLGYRWDIDGSEAMAMAAMIIMIVKP